MQRSLNSFHSNHFPHSCSTVKHMSESCLIESGGEWGGGEGKTIKAVTKL